MRKLKYKELQIIKHSLQYYIKRPNARPKEIEEEKQLIDKITFKVDRLKEKYGII